MQRITKSTGILQSRFNSLIRFKSDSRILLSCQACDEGGCNLLILMHSRSDRGPVKSDLEALQDSSEIIAQSRPHLENISHVTLDPASVSSVDCEQTGG